MKLSQLFKISSVVLALGVAPMHTAFAHEGCESETSTTAENKQTGSVDVAPAPAEG